MSTFIVNHTPYLQPGNAPLAPFAGSETDRVQIIWQTVPGSGSGNDSFVVEYRHGGAPTWIDAGPTSTINTGVSNRVNRFVDVTGLDYDADYEYRVRHMRDASVVHDYQATFHTRLPAGSNKPFTFVAYGDSASGTPPTGFLNVQNRINTITSSFVVMMGDNAYGSGTHAQYDLRFDPSINAPTTTYNKNHVEYYSLGNHDIATAAGQPSRDNYAVPIPVAGVTSSVNGPSDGPAENNYSFDYGNAHFAIYDSNNGISTAEANWMLADMQASTARWKFVVFHHPMSTTDALGDQLRAAGVDVLLGGHIHSYSRSNSGSQFTEGNQLIQVIGGTGGASTTIANQGFLKIDATATSLTVSQIRADSGNVVDSFTITSQSTGSGSAPTNVTLSANTVVENAANNTVVGTLTTTDPDAGDTHTYTLTNNAGGRFGISGNQLVVANGSLLNFETNTSHIVTVRSTDSAGLNFSKNFTINVTNVNEAPTANSNTYAVNHGATLNANDSTGSVGGTNDDSLLVNDTDPENNSLTATKVTDPTHGALTLNANGTFTYTHNNDSATSDSFTYRVSDGSNQSNIATVTITIDPGGSAPATISLQDGVNGYAGTIDTTIKADFPTSTSGASATTIEARDNPGKGSLIRWELPSLPTGSIVQSASITLWVTNGATSSYQLYELLRTWTEGGATWNQYATGAVWGTAGAQQIGVDRAATVVASLTSTSTGLVTINLNADGLAMLQKWINTPSTNHGVTIQNYVTTTSDGVGFDSSEASTAGNRPKLTFTYSIPPTPPTISTTASALSYTENNPATAIDPGLTTSDPDSANYVGATVSITGGFTPGEDVLGFANQSGILGAYNPATGVLTLSGASNPANYQTALRSVTYVNTSENPNAANRSVTFLVNDGALTGNATRTINVTSVNDAPTAMTFLGHGDNVPEQSFPGEVGDFVTTDPDLADSHTYSLTDDAGGRFTIFNDELFVANGSLLDFETNTSHSITVLSTDSGGLSVSTTFTINVGDVNEMPTGLTLVGNSVPEQTALGTDVGNLSTIDPDAGDSHTYSLVDDAGGRFAIFGDQLVVASGNLLDVETNTSHSVTILSTDSGGQSFSMQFTISVTDVNEFDPVLNDATFSLAENSANSTSVGTLLATDADATDGGLSYSISGGNVLGIFAINSATGEITVADNSNLDRESAASVVLTVTVSDNGPGSARTDTAQVTININDVNDVAPVVTAGRSATIAENLSNGSSVLALAATDGDVTATTFQNWTITGGSGSTAFAINASTGAITVLDSAQLNREATTGFTLLVTVSDGVHTSAAQTVSISLNDANEFTPVVTAAQTFTLPENSPNSTMVGTMLATDGDASPSLSGWAITGGTGATAFSINADTGQITVLNSAQLDFETTSSFTLFVTVSDGTNTSTVESVTISVSDVVNEFAPVLNDATFLLAENSANSTSVGTVTGTDADPTNGGLSYSITGGNTLGVFAINSATGEITVADNTHLDRETVASVVLTITVSDNGPGTARTDTAQVTINIDDVNEFTPMVTAAQSFSLAENAANTTVVATVLATDGDPTASFGGWTITGGTGATAFAINAGTGQITVVDSAQLDLESISSFTLLVTVSDGTNTSAVNSVTVLLSDVNEFDPVLNDATFSLAENSANSTSVGTMTSTDADATDGGLSYSITGGNSLGIFTINNVTGAITVSDKTNLDRETVASVVLTITTSDNGPGSARTDTAQVTVNINDVNDVMPVVTASQSAAINENLTNGSSVLSLAATDGDVTATTFQNWAITGGSGSTAFAINASTGEVTVLDSAQFNRESTASFTLQVMVSDGVHTSAAQSVTISLNDVNEAPTANGNVYSVNRGATLNANDANGTVGGTNDNSVLVNDTDPENNVLSAVLVAGPAHASTFTLNGNGTFTYTHNNDTATSDSFTYRATDGLNQSDIATVTITINPGGGTTTTVSLQDGVNGYAGTIDSTIKADFPTSTSGSSATSVEAKDNPDRGSLLRWELPSSLTGSTVQSASIMLRVNNGTNSNYQLYELLRSWTEGGATWNQFAAGAGWGTAGAQQIGVDRAAAVLASLTSPATGFVTINLNADGIALVQKWINTPSSNFGITIQNYATTSGDAISFDSSEATTAANRPKLTITYSTGGASNNPPTVATTAAVLAYTENNSATSIDPGLTTSDLDSANYLGATVSITGGFASGQDVLGFSNQNGISGAYNTSTGVLTLSGTSSVANYQTALRSVTYVNTSENPSTANRTVTFSVNDGALTGSANRTLSVTSVNDAPTAITNSYSVNRGATLNANDATGTVGGTNDDSLLVNDTDPENNSLTAVKVTDPTHGTLTLNANGTFTYTHNNDSATSDSFTYRVSDGTSQSNIATVTIAINSPPTITTTGAALAYTENNPATAIDLGLTTSDVDSANYVGATVSITGGFASGQDVLGFSNQNGISGAYNASTGVLTLSGTSSVANYQTALRSVTYVNTSENPSTANRTVTFSVNDGALTGSASRTISVTPVNDAPTANHNSYSVSQGGTLNADDATGTVGLNNDSVLVNDTDPENNSLTAVKVTDPTHGTLTLNANGTFTYTHNNDSATSDSFTYRASDGTNQSNIATVTITINPGGGTTTTVSLQDGVNGYAGTIDTTIKADFPTSTSGSSATTVEAKDSPDRGSLLRWELPSSLAGNIVQSASITLRVTNGTNSTYQLYELLRSWTEAGATWNQYAAGTGWGTAGAQQIGVDRAAAVLASLTSPATGFVTINLNADGIALVQKWINTPSSNHGVTIQNYVTTSADAISFDSSEATTAANRPKLTITYGTGSPLVAAASASVTNSVPTGSTLTDSALAQMAREAAARWLTITPAGMHESIRTAANSITFAIADLPGQTLGTSFEQTILIDRDAAGFGWFIDRTPGDDREFGAFHDALPTSPADGHMDLLSVVAHEIGHSLGYEHDSTLDVMHESLAAGHRTISIDRDAAGFGSMIDQALPDDHEYGAWHDALQMISVDGHMNLLLVAADEIGNLLGYDHDSTLVAPRDSLETGRRTITDEAVSTDAVDWFFQGVGLHLDGPVLNPFM